MAKLKYWTLLVSLLFSAARAESPAAPLRYTLEEMLSRVESRNPMLASGREKTSAARAMVNGARSLMPPMAGAGSGFEGDFTVELQQPLPGFGKRSAKAAQLQSLAREAAEDTAVTRNALLAEAKRAYYARMISERRIQVLEENAKPLKLLVKTSGSQVVYGKASAAAVFKAQAKLAKLDAMRIHEEGAAREKTVLLNYWMGNDLNTAFDIDTALSLKYYPPLSGDTSREILAGRRSALRKMDQAIETMKLSRRLIALQWMPDFGIKTEVMGEAGGDSRVSLMGTATLPFLPWSAGGYRAEAQAMDFQIKAMEHEREDYLREITTEAKRIFIELQSEYKEVDKYAGEIIPPLKKTLELTLLAYGQNTADLLETLMAWDDLAMAQMEYLYHLENTFNAEANYEKSIERP